MVLLLHWSMLNYTAVQKILKKHDKQSGVVLRAPFLASVLQQVGPPQPPVSDRSKHDAALC